MTSGDNRYFPREVGRIDLRYQVVESERAATLGRAWVQGLREVEPERPWRTPDPVMDFSASGLCFKDEASVGADEVLLLEFRLPTRSEPYRAAGRVVRSETVVGTGTRPMKRIAVDFVEVANETVAALVEFTDHCQTEALSAEFD